MANVMTLVVASFHITSSLRIDQTPTVDMVESGTYCQLEAMTARCRWNSEVILVTSARWGRMAANRCLQIHPNVLAVLGHDPLFLGCSQDVLFLMDSKCSGRSECEIHIPDSDLDEVKPCYQDLKSYLTASYSCVKGTILADVLRYTFECFIYMLYYTIYIIRLTAVQRLATSNNN